jgi:hypothetical protein
MVAAHKTQHKLDKIAKEQKWPNHYGDLNPLPSLDWSSKNDDDILIFI